MDQQDQQKHVCKVCDRMFPCGQSLGGHMRSHVVNLVTTSVSLLISNADDENGGTSKSNFQQSSINNTSYGLRENPTKANRFTRSSEEDASDENLCKSCGKGFQSSKALFGHMKCHSEKLIADTTIEEELGRQSVGNEEADAALLYSRRRSRRMTRNKISYASENEQEDVARSLMMLSKDSWCSNEVYSDDDIATPKKGNVGKRTCKEICSDNAEELGLSSKRESNKRNKFECGTCKKMFHSYQALGGHRASHKKIKGCYASKLDQAESENGSEQYSNYSMATRTDSNLTIAEVQEIRDLPNEGLKKGKSKEHECPFCFKIFSSGQALGGHKRSHLLNSSPVIKTNNQSIAIQEPTTTGHGLLDLNLPAPTDQDDTPRPSQVTDFSIKLWWGMGGCSTEPDSPIGISL